MGVFVLKALAVVAAILIVHRIFEIVKRARQLRHIPGPSLCRFSDLVRATWVQRGTSHLKHTALHEKYGDVVAIGPSTVDVSDPAMVPIIYPMRAGFPKSDFYSTLMPYTASGSALPSVFNTRDEEIHKQLKNPIAATFSMTNVLKFESAIDQVIDLMLDQLDNRFASNGTVCDFSKWIQFCAFEVMAMMTFSTRYGFLERGEDDNGLIEAVWRFMSTAAPVSQAPWLDKILYKNRVVATVRGTAGMPILKMALDSIKLRMNLAADSGLEKDPKAPMEGDMLDHFLAVQRANPTIPEYAPVVWVFANLNAGSDSTAAVLQTLWHNLLLSRESAKKLYDELVEAGVSPKSSYMRMSNLRFLDACVNEALRLHPPFCLPFERVVPAEGVTVCDKFLPGGTIVGMNPWVVNRHKDTFGTDADAWRPERWLCGPEERKRMDKAMLTYGAGKRICLGKRIADVEIKKVTCALMLKYEMNIVDPEGFTTENLWFFRQKGLKVQMRRRDCV